MLDIRIDNYGWGSSPSSQIKTMCITLGKYKLYFSYNTLVGFYDGKTYFVTNKNRSRTTSKHIWSIGDWSEKKIYVKEDLLRIIVYSTLLNKNMEEIETELRLKRISKDIPSE